MPERQKHCFKELVADLSITANGQVMVPQGKKAWFDGDRADQLGFGPMAVIRDGNLPEVCQAGKAAVLYSAQRWQSCQEDVHRPILMHVRGRVLQLHNLFSAHPRYLQRSCHE